MQDKSLISRLLLIIIITVILITTEGCSKKPEIPETPKDKFITAFEKTADIKTNQSTTKFQINFDSIDFIDDPKLKIIGNVLNGNTVTLNSKNNIYESISNTSINMATMGIDMNGDIILNNGTIAFKVPIILSLLGIEDKYITTDIEQLINEKLSAITFLPTLTTRETKKVLDEVCVEIIKEHLTEDLILEELEQEIKLPEGTITGTGYTIVLNNDQIKLLAKEILSEFVNNKLIKDKVINALENMEKVKENQITSEEIENNPDEVIEKLFKNITLNLNIKYFVDQENYIRNVEDRKSVV